MGVPGCPDITGAPHVIKVLEGAQLLTSWSPEKLPGLLRSTLAFHDLMPKKWPRTTSYRRKTKTFYLEDREPAKRAGRSNMAFSPKLRARTPVILATCGCDLARSLFYRFRGYTLNVLCSSAS